MALAGELAKHIGNELVGTGGKGLAKAGAKSALSSLVPSVATKSGEGVTRNILVGQAKSDAERIPVAMGDAGNISLFRGIKAETPELLQKYIDDMMNPNIKPRTYEGSAYGEGYYFTPFRDGAESYASNDLSRPYQAVLEISPTKGRFLGINKANQNRPVDFTIRAENRGVPGGKSLEVGQRDYENYLKRNGIFGNRVKAGLDDSIYVVSDNNALKGMKVVGSKAPGGDWEYNSSLSNLLPSGSKVKFDKDLNMEQVDAVAKKYLGAPAQSPNLSPIVADENGVAKTFYHGSPSMDITDFDMGMAGKNTRSGEKAIWFTDDYPTAEEFSYERIPGDSLFADKRGAKGKVYERNLGLENPLDLSNLSDKQIEELYKYADSRMAFDGKENFIRRMKEFRDAKNDQLIKGQLDMEKLSNSEYDGIVAKMYPGENEVREIGVFDTGKIKKPDAKQPAGYSNLINKAKNYKSLDRFEKMNNPIKGSEIWGEKPTSAFQRDSRAVRINMFPNNAVKGTGITKQYLLNLLKDAYDQGITNIVPSYGSYTKEGASFMDHLAEQGWVKATGKNGWKSYEVSPKIAEWKKTNPLEDIYNEAHNIPEVQQSLGLSPQQQEFFKDSVVRDENGELIPMFHGSNSNFTIFDKSKGGQSNKSAKVGFWFTPNKEGAEKWAEQSWWGNNEPKVYETYLNIKKPFIYEEADNSSQIAKLKSELKIAQDDISSLYYTNRDSKEYYDAYKRYNNIAKQIEDLSYTDPYEQFRSHIYAMEGKSPSQANTGGVGMVMDNEDEAVKKYVEMLKSEGYDGIIIKGTNYDRNTMGSKNDQYVVFDPEQIKNVDNKKPTKSKDIRYAIAAAMGLGSIIGPYMNSQKSVDNVE